MIDSISLNDLHKDHSILRFQILDSCRAGGEGMGGQFFWAVGRVCWPLFLKKNSTCCRLRSLRPCHVLET